MSALPPEADILRGGLDVRLVPKADITQHASVPQCTGYSSGISVVLVRKAKDACGSETPVEASLDGVVLHVVSELARVRRTNCRVRVQREIEAYPEVLVYRGAVLSFHCCSAGSRRDLPAALAERGGRP